MPIYFDVRAPKKQKASLPYPPFVQIFLKQRVEDDTGTILLASQLMSDEEIDKNIDLLKENLESLRKVAKQMLSKQDR